MKKVIGKRVDKDHRIVVKFLILPKTLETMDGRIEKKFLETVYVGQYRAFGSSSGTWIDYRWATKEEFLNINLQTKNF